MDFIKLREDSSLVRIFHVSSCDVKVDVFINDKLVFDNIDFKELSKYTKLKAGSYKVDVYESGKKTNPLLKQIVEVKGGEFYTISIIRNKEESSLLVINDYASKTTSEDYSSFRIINLANNNEPVDIIIDEDILFKNIAYKEGTIYADVNIDEYNIKIARSIDNKTFTKSKIKCRALRIYTIYIIKDNDKLSLIQSVDGNTYLRR